MKNFVYFLILFLGLQANYLWSQDTLFQEVDTILFCTYSQSNNFLTTHYDTSLYDSKWYELDSTSFSSDLDSLDISNLELVVLISCSNMNDSVYVDTIAIDLRIYPEINLEIPPEKCFDGNPILFSDNSDLNDYTTVVYFSDDGEELVPPNLSINVDNGSSKKITAIYTVDMCPDTIEEKFDISTKLQPTAKFTQLTTCENEFLELENLSLDTLNSEYIFQIGSEIFETEYNNLFTFQDLLSNGSYEVMGVVGNMNECSDTFTFQVDIEEVTYVNFIGLEDSYCVNQGSSVLIGSENGGVFSGMFISSQIDNMVDFVPTEPATNLEIFYSFTNNEGCSDTSLQIVSTIFPKPQLEFIGLNMELCELDMASEIILNQTLNDSSEYSIYKDSELFDEVTSLNYLFDPEIPGDYSIFNMYTDIEGCYDTIRENIIVHPLPKIELDPLKVIIPGEELLIGNTLGDEPNVDYIWSNGDFSSSISVSQPGIYIINAINVETSCQASDTILIEYDKLIETDLIEVSLSPNPTEDVVNISLSKPVQNIRLINVFGDPIELNGSSVYNTDQMGFLSLDLFSQDPGYYYLLIPDIGNFLILKV